jgi:uncharacterized protein YgbK (DUF1537 family)
VRSCSENAYHPSAIEDGEMSDDDGVDRPADLTSVIAAESRGRPLIVLDDDPTGTQTVRGARVLTSWSTDRLAAALRDNGPVTFLLTNSRSLPGSAAASLARTIGRTIRDASARASRPVSVVSRSDSTLRGHFPIEVDALAGGLGVPEARCVLAPFFGDGGRITMNSVHYLRRDGVDVPVANTEFAHDPVFGYRSSDLRDWVRERTSPRSPAVQSVDLATNRSRGPDAVVSALQRLPARGVLIVDAVEERDIEVVALGVLRAEAAGVPVLVRSAASYVRARAGQAQSGLLDDEALHQGRPGLVVVGSYVPTSSTQLARLLADPPVPLVPIEVRVDELLALPPEAAKWTGGQELAMRANTALGAGHTPVVHTSRQVIRDGRPKADLALAKRVSAALVQVVKWIERQPAWVLVKGGITSSDIATEALGMQEALVVGQLLPGVAVWHTGADTRWPGRSYVVFPGNVGTDGSLREAVVRLVGRD